jgi:hypothetical protein
MLSLLCFLHFLTTVFQLDDILAVIVFFFVEFLPEDGQKMPEQVGGLALVCIACIYLQCSCWCIHDDFSYCTEDA